MTNEDLAHIEAIKQLKARYCRLIDSRAWSRLEEQFAPDAQFEGFRIVSEGVDAAGFVSELAAALGGSLTVHHCHTPEIQITGAGSAAGIWAMMDIVEWPEERPVAVSPSAIGFRGYGFYEERYGLIDGLWRISFMRLTRTRVDPITRSGRDPSYDPFSHLGDFTGPDPDWLVHAAKG